MTPEYFLRWFLTAWLAALVVMIVYRVVTGRISLGGLITMDGRRFSPERLQLVLITLAMLASYINEAMSAKSMPTLPSELIGVLAASHALYLGGKVAGR